MVLNKKGPDLYRHRSPLCVLFASGLLVLMKRGVAEGGAEQQQGKSRSDLSHLAALCPPSLFSSFFLIKVLSLHLSVNGCAHALTVVPHSLGTMFFAAVLNVL